MPLPALPNATRGRSSKARNQSPLIHRELRLRSLSGEPILIVVNGIPWSGEGKGKRNFTDYMKWRSDYASDNSQIWSEYGGLLYVKPNAFASGQTMVVYGLVGFPIPSSDSDPLPFELLSDEDSASGDQAIILLAYASLLASEKKKNPQGAAAAATEAYNLLDTLWLIIAERRAQQPQTDHSSTSTTTMRRAIGRPAGIPISLTSHNLHARNRNTNTHTAQPTAAPSSGGGSSAPNTELFAKPGESFSAYEARVAEATAATLQLLLSSRRLHRYPRRHLHRPLILIPDSPQTSMR